MSRARINQMCPVAFIHVGTRSALRLNWLALSLPMCALQFRWLTSGPYITSFLCYLNKHITAHNVDINRRHFTEQRTSWSWWPCHVLAHITTKQQTHISHGRVHGWVALIQNDQFFHPHYSFDMCQQAIWPLTALPVDCWRAPQQIRHRLNSHQGKCRKFSTSKPGHTCRNFRNFVSERRLATVWSTPLISVMVFLWMSMMKRCNWEPRRTFVP